MKDVSDNDFELQKNKDFEALMDIEGWEKMIC